MNNILDKINYKSKKIFISIMVVLITVIFFSNYDGDIDSYNTTILALNYSYGFISRGFTGTVFMLLSKCLPIDIITPEGAKVFLMVSTILLFFIIVMFAVSLIKRCNDKGIANLEILIVYMMVVTVSTYSSGWNFGRVDIYMIMISLGCAMLLVVEKGEWLIILLCPVAVLIHQGYVLMYLNIVLALLAYKILSYREKRIKYIIIFVLTTIICVALLLYLELYSHSGIDDISFREVVGNATSLSEEGTYHETLLEHELKGIDLSSVEHDYHMKNLAEIIIYGILMLPYIVIFFRFVYSLIKNAEDNISRFKYIIVCAGSLTMLPDYLIKVDYGRWIVATILYYLVTFSVLYVLDDYVKGAIDEQITKVKKRGYIWLILLIYPILFIPYRDVNIDKITALIGHVLNRDYLNWW